MSSNDIFPTYPKDWRSLTLGELAKEWGGSIQTGPFGSQLHASDYVGCGIPSIMPKNISVDGVLENDIAQIKPEDAERLAKYRVRLGDIVYSRRGDVEKCCLITKKEDGWLCGTGCLRVRIPADNILQQYIHAYLCHPAVRNWVVRHAIGATMPNLNTSILSALPVLIPTTKEMQRIVEIWSTASKKIILNTKINQTLEHMAQALFKSWFVDFDPVIDNALEAGNPIPESLAERAARRQAMWAADNETAPARLPAKTRRLFPDQFEEDGVLGWEPEGWKAGKLSQLATLNTTSINPGKEPEKEFEHYSIPAFDAALKPSFDSGESIKSGKYKVDEKAILVSKLNPGTQRIWWVAPSDKEAAICSTEFMQFVPKESESRAFIYCLLKSDSVQNEILNSVTGTTGSRQRAQPKKVAVADILLPNSEVIHAFSECVQPMKDKQVKNIEQSVSLAQLRDVLLPKLLSGELQLPEAKAAVDTALEAETA